MEAERALVTGGTGFIGQELARRLADNGFEVTAVGRSSGDVTDPRAMRRLLAETRPSHVFHLAGVRNGKLDELLRSNVSGTANVLEAAAAEAPAARVLVAGSAAEYGETTREPVAEDQPLQPVTDYGVAKTAQELAAFALAVRHGLRLTRVRLFNVLGPGEPPSFVASALAGRIAAIQAGTTGPPLRTGDLNTRRDFVDVRDVARALHLAATRGEDGAVYNVCSGTATPIRALVEELLAVAGLDVAVESTPEPAVLNVRGHAGSAERLRTATGWEPQHALRDSLADVLAAQQAAHADR
ncbi:MAG TPA: NAD-dependent epimerase/dehydratase family protein [Gaiellaceae bacterium]|nr:NAD-dependent epimerase/dehydratase family protein [Gaiellaceae bacterium]